MTARAKGYANERQHCTAFQCALTHLLLLTWQDWLSGIVYRLEKTITFDRQIFYFIVPLACSL